MSDVIGARAPGWFRLLAVLGLAWNGFGVYMYLEQGRHVRRSARRPRCRPIASSPRSVSDPG